MSRRAELVLKIAYLVVLAVAVAVWVNAIDGGVDAQVEALPYYAQIWAR
jgi:hypothetical protein